MSSRDGQQASHDQRWPSVGIVVLTWENYEDTAECLDSLRSVEYPNFEVVVVDNGSTDRSSERLEEEYDWCDFVFNDENLGFAAGNNPGIEYALSNGVDYVLLLNNDTIVPNDFLTPLVETARDHDDAVAVGGVQYYAGSEEVYNAGSRFVTYLGGRVSPSRTVKQPEAYEVDHVLTSLVLLDAGFVRDNDILHEGYFVTTDDVDLAMQARENGRKVMIEPRSRIEHKVERSFEKSPFDVYHEMRNRLHLAEERLSTRQRRLFYVGLALSMAHFCLSWILDGKTDLIKATAIGAYDHINDNEFKLHESF
jgi:GT2 family glycosyltransferase